MSDVISHRCCYYLSALSGSLCPPFKIVILDEGDFMTASAQVREIHRNPCN